MFYYAHKYVILNDIKGVSNIINLKHLFFNESGTFNFTLITSIVSIITLIVVIKKNKADLTNDVRKKKIDDITLLTAEFLTNVYKISNITKTICNLIGEDGKNFVNAQKNLANPKVADWYEQPFKLTKEFDEVRMQIILQQFKLDALLFEDDEFNTEINNELHKITSSVEKMYGVLMRYGGFENWDVSQSLEIREQINNLLNTEHSVQIAVFLHKIKQFNNSEWKKLKKGK
ncbi:hypothetical protein MKR28_11420 [Staphylococcus haemolyticus]|uniref:hypothetical protein n=1 Tax=Staphylococcus haemolyticus TaxID=1283 RepID=UPI001F0A2701|nr:hypothetical protein [Staphylococcus haemolyticus]MCH4461009.1 hypothetical protein [Staphylococcus haemolyticus]